MISSSTASGPPSPLGKAYKARLKPTDKSKFEKSLRNKKHRERCFLFIENIEDVDHFKAFADRIIESVRRTATAAHIIRDANL